MRFAALTVASLLALVPAAPAVAAAPPKPSTAVGQYVDLTTLAVPVVAEGKVRNYVFVRARLNLTSKADVVALRAKAPWFRDALVRAAHRSSLADPKDPSRVDEARLSAVLAGEATRIAGPGLIASAEVTFQAAQRRLAVGAR